jgi:DNA primase
MRAKEAKQIAIVEYLSLTGNKPTSERKGGKEIWYSSPIRDGDSNPSFKVDTLKNLWFDFGISKGGNIIDLVMFQQGATIKEALAILEGTGLYSNKDYVSLFPTVNKTTSNNKQIAGEKEKRLVFEILGVGKITKNSLLDYLSKRAINLDVARKYLKQVHYKTRVKKRAYYALAWACGDGYEARSEFFKGFIGTNKDIIKINLKNNQTLSIFEGFMDFLSFLTYYNKPNFQNSVIILNGINFRTHALEEIKNYNFSKIYLFLDNDQGGKTTREFFMESIKGTSIVDKSHLYKKHNDFNAMIIEESKNGRN